MLKTAQQYEHWEELLNGMTPEQREVIETAMANATSVDIIIKPCGKVKYGHKETAVTAADAMHKKTGDTYDAYRCPPCNAWHIGHSR